MAVLLSSSRYFTDTACTIPAADGDFVAGWKTADGVTAVQATESKRPQLVTFLGKPCLYFDGVNDELVVASFSEVAQPNVIVCAFWGIDLENQNRTLDSAGPNRQLWGLRNSPDGVVFGYAGSSCNGLVDRTGLARVFTFTFDGANSSAAIDGISEALDSNDAGNQSIDNLIIGSDGSSAYFKGFIFAIGIAPVASKSALETEFASYIPYREYLLWSHNASTPILSASAEWEQDAIQEFRPINRAGNFVATYSGGWTTQSIGLARSTNFLDWTKNADPVIGNGFGGESGNCGRSCTVLVGGVLEVYYTDGIPGTGNWWRVTSDDDGETFGDKTAVLTEDDLPVGYVGYANSYMALDGDVWRLIIELCVSGSEFALFTSTSPDRVTWAPLQELLGLPLGGSTSPCYWEKENGVYHIFTHCGLTANIPTDIFHATSEDFVTCQQLACSFPRQFEINTDGSIDQTADMRMVTIGSTLYAAYARANNVTQKSDIALSTFSGTFAELLGEEPPAPSTSRGKLNLGLYLGL